MAQQEVMQGCIGQHHSQARMVGCHGIRDGGDKQFFAQYNGRNKAC